MNCELLQQVHISNNYIASIRQLNQCHNLKDFAVNSTNMIEIDELEFLTNNKNLLYCYIEDCKLLNYNNI